MLKKILFSFFFFSLQTLVFSQITGDYRSKGTGNWTLLSSWEYYNGSGWSQPSGTSPQGYPGQYIGTGIVTIRNGSDITISNSIANSFAELVIGDGISGNLIVGADVVVKALNVTINAGSKMKFSGNNDITFPENTVIKLNSGGEIDDDGSCNNNVAIYIGTKKYAVCKGAGNAEYTFTDINSSSGTLDSKPGSYSPVCGNVVNLAGSYSGIINDNKPVTYLWTASGPSSVVFSNNTSAATSATTSVPGVYSFTLTVANDGYSNYETTSVTVSALPIITGNFNICSGSTTTLTGSGTPNITSPWVSSTPSVATVNNSGIVTGVAAGTTAITFRNSNGCTKTEMVTITGTLGGTVLGGSSPLCQGSSTGNLSLSGYTGSIVQWERQVNSGGWSNVGNGGLTTYSEVPYSSGNWEYRVLVRNGSCPSMYSSVRSITVDPTPSGGGVYDGNQTICINSSTGTMNLRAGYIGNVVRWEKRLLPATTWTNIINTTATYSESPSTAGTWEYRVLVGSGSCTQVYSSSFSVIVNPTLTISVGQNPIVCQTSTVTSLPYSATTGSPAGWILDFDAVANSAGFSDQNGGLNASPNSITVNVPYSVAAGIYNATLRVISYYPSCTSVDYPVSVTVISPPNAPVLGTVIQPSCTTSTGSIVINGLPSSGIWTLYQNGTSIGNGTGATKTIVALGVGDYKFTVSVGSCSSSPSAMVRINSGSTTSWASGAWSNGVPTLSTEAILNGDYNTTSNGDINACSLIINSGTLTIGNKNFVTIQNDLTVNPSGVMKILNQGSLVMINDSGIITYKGVIEVNKTTTPFEKYDYTYWSSPIVGPANIGAIFPTWRTDYAFAFHPENFIDANNDGFDDNGDDYINASTMDPGRGYIIMGPTSGSFPRTEALVFTGKVNNGVVKTEIVLTPGTDPEDDFNLVGNPYPSAISADALIKANISGTGTINKTIEGTLYFWTHKADISVSNPGPDGLNFSQDDYAVYNLSGGIGTSGSASGGGKPLGYIASGQGFFVEADVAGYLTFNNSMRVSPSTVSSQPTPTNANTQFYKILPVKDKAVTKDRVWLNLENADGMFSQQLVGYFENTTMGIDNGYDGLVSDAGNYVSFYSFIDEGIYKIQGRESFDNKDQVRLGYFSAVAGPFNINIDSKEGVFVEDQTNVYLEDKLTNTIHDLKKGPYNFETESGTYNDRFVLRYTDKKLGTGDFDKANMQVMVSVKNKQININSSIETIDKVIVYDLSGRPLYQKIDADTKEFSIQNLVSSHQALFIKIILRDGQIVTSKIIF
jgi:hypothetical protein